MKLFLYFIVFLSETFLNNLVSLYFQQTLLSSTLRYNYYITIIMIHLYFNYCGFVFVLKTQL